MISRSKHKRSALIAAIATAALIAASLTTSCEDSVQGVYPPSAYIGFTKAPRENEVVRSSSVAFEWNSASDSIRFRILRVNADNVYEEYYTWTDFSDTTKVTYPYLDEGVYRFELESLIPEIYEIVPIQRNFTVDATKGPALRFYRLQSIFTEGSSDTISIIYEDVDSLSTYSIGVRFNPEILTLLEVKNGAKLEEFLYKQQLSPDMYSAARIAEANVNGEFAFTSVITTIGGQKIEVSGEGELMQFIFRADSVASTKIEMSAPFMYRSDSSRIVPTTGIDKVIGHIEVRE
ncbi:MAG: hypothetical protein GF419_14640 [Ignavibacteriales bacterium]|nr:hypothetical protein [Ignavibacteriales bacterium]